LIIQSILNTDQHPNQFILPWLLEYHRIAPVGVNSNACGSSAARRTQLSHSGNCLRHSCNSFSCVVPCRLHLVLARTLVVSGGSQYHDQSPRWAIVVLPRPLANSTVFFLSIRLPLLRLQLIPDRQPCRSSSWYLFTCSVGLPRHDRGAPVSVCRHRRQLLRHALLQTEHPSSSSFPC
jgi:hypothetical protein